VEKYLKALLAFHGQTIPRKHDLEELQRLCVPLMQGEEFSAVDLTELSGYAVELRYDTDFWPAIDTAAQAVALAETLRRMVMSTLPAEARP
jgi:HEPN domain-containing protein